ncbi:DUF192 domain-containing protein [Candidatus Kaiserbacteria bacterium]|nr:DUF192 domain-containing protein [Candidatus Kaiserbacteria bacterium]
MSTPIIARQSNFGTGVVFALIAGLLVLGFIFYENGVISLPSFLGGVAYKTIKINNLSLKVHIAKTSEEQLASLNGVRTIAQDEGMLFVFKTDGIYEISTANMLFPVDLMWINNEGTIVDTAANVAPGLRDPVSTQAYARYVLMVNAGTMTHNDILRQTTVDLPLLP